MKKAFNFLRNCVEIYIPVSSFCIMFIVFIYQIFARYVLDKPAPWAYEVTVTCYLWMVVLSACYAQREKSHVTFTLFYDKLSVKGKAICDFLGNLIVSFAFGISIIPSIRFVDFMKIQKTSVLQVGLNYVYAPYILFVVIIFIYAICDMYRDVMIFTGLGDKKYEEDLLSSTKSETQEAIDNSINMEE
ncbi:MAG: TRAP transporter small permease [Lachnospirales bacterium]